MKMLRFSFYNIFMTFKSFSTYRAATTLKAISTLFLILVYLFLWTGIYGEQNLINGYTLNELLLFIILLRVMRQIYPFQTSQHYAQMIKSGEISSWLIKPVRFELHLLSQAIGRSFYNLIFTGIPSFLLIPIFAFLPNIPFYSVLIALLFFLSSFIFVFLIEIIIGVMGYYSLSIWGLNSFKGAVIAFFSGELLPLSFYPIVFLNFLRFLPFSSIYYFPISILIGKSPMDLWMVFAILWISIILMFLVYQLLSRKMIKLIMIQGG